MSRPMEIDVWAGDWGLPTVDVECLQVLVYCKFTGAPIQVNPTSNPFRTTLPTFRYGTSSLHTLSDIVSFLKGKNINADYALDEKQIYEVHAYDQLLKEKLQPALQYVWWVDERNFTELTRPWYAKVLPFPLNYYYPGRYEREAKDLINALYGSLQEEALSVETQIYGDAEKCLTLLSNRLGDSPFFFGNAPTSLDAIVFSYLAPLLKAPFPKPTLQNHLKACTNLVSFVNRIIQKYYPTLNTEYQRKTAEAKRQEAETEFPHKRRNQFLFGLLSVAAMTAYAFSSGILQVSFVDEMEDYDAYDIDESDGNSTEE